MACEEGGRQAGKGMKTHRKDGRQTDEWQSTGRQAGKEKIVTNKKVVWY